MGDVVLGLVCGLASEAALITPGPSVRIGISGARPDAASTEARRLVAEGATHLISFGLAGALSSDLPPGTLLLPECVKDEAGQSWATDRSLYTDIPGADTACTLPLLGVERVIDTPRDKQALYGQYSCAAVDMESHRTAAIAAEARLPFTVIRTVADPAHRALPKSAAGTIAEDGTVRTGVALRGLLARPWELPLLLRLKQDSDAAHAALSAVDISTLIQQARPD